LHEAVLVDEIISFVRTKDDPVVLDCTLGNAGHTKAISEFFGGRCTIIALDQDTEAIERSQKKLFEYTNKITFIHSNFVLLDTVLEQLGVKNIDVCLMDVGVSKNQLVQPERGFSFLHEGPLDMRMDTTQELTARDVVNTYSEDELFEIVKNYGEERFARSIVRAICTQRTKSPIETTTELADLVKRASRSKKFSRIHPATRTFQALRIAVNNELENLQLALNKIVPFLSDEGLILVISFHSLEDRIVKMTFRQWAQEKKVTVLTKKPIIASEEEVQRNPHSRSAKLRVAKRSLQ
jgi:16S rRNA (cytosine1402-N4)-methyltransferase